MDDPLLILGARPAGALHFVTLLLAECAIYAFAYGYLALRPL